MFVTTQRDGTCQKILTFTVDKSKLEKERDGKNRDFSADGTAHVFLDTMPRWLLILFAKELEYASTSKSITLHG